MSALATVKSVLNPLSELQKNFCLLVFGSELKIGLLSDIKKIKNGQQTTDLVMYKESTGRTLMMRFLEQLPAHSDSKKIIQEFMTDPNTAFYNKTAFTPLPTSQGTLNYWVPPKVTASAGEWSLIREFLENVICDSDLELFDYLKNYLAHMLQKPEEKPEVMLVFLGGQGTGKGTFFRLLRKIWSTTLQVSDIDHVIGGFNSALERSFIVCMDEALFAGQRKAMDRLKSFISEPVIIIEKKFQDRRSIDSVHRFFAATNHSHFGNVEQDDRRFVFFRLSDSHQEMHQYFSTLNQAINDSSQLAALVYYLQSIDLTNFNIRTKPKTKELLAQKIQSLSGFSRYWYEALCHGRLDVASAVSLYPWEDSDFISSERLYEHYGAFQKGSRHQYEPVQLSDIKKGLEKWCPQATHIRKMNNNLQSRGYQLPSLKEGRKMFGQILKHDINWE
tara:strand:+ start:442 stop:1779 length:1338 start_codon:yes stop_codon:yes gene_type:complete